MLFDLTGVAFKKAIQPINIFKGCAALLDVVTGVPRSVTAQPLIHASTFLPFSSVCVAADEAQKLLLRSVPHQR